MSPVGNPAKPPITMTEQEITDRAQEAGRIINSAVYQQAVTEAEKAIVREWMLGKTTEDRENAWLRLQALKELHRQFNGFLEDGKALARKKQKRNGHTNWNPA